MPNRMVRNVFAPKETPPTKCALIKTTDLEENSTVRAKSHPTVSPNDLVGNNLQVQLITYVPHSTKNKQQTRGKP